MLPNTRVLHPSLPKGLTLEELSLWLKNNAVEQFKDIQKRVYSEEELESYTKEATKSQIEINNIEDLKKKVIDLITKGTRDGEKIEIPSTEGVKFLKTVVRMNLDKVNKGYEEHELEIFGLPNHETEMMDYFDYLGNEIADRSRPLSAREIQKHIGMFHNGDSRQAM